MLSRSTLQAKKSRPQVTAMDDGTLAAHLSLLPEWSMVEGCLQREFGFRNYYQAIAWVNALAYLCHTEDHHPELVVNYKTVLVKYQTHSVNQGRGGMSENDFICAVKADTLYEQALK